MKKLLLSLLVVSAFAIAGVNAPGAIGVSIVDYNTAHKNSIMDISFQDPLFFPGSKTIPEEVRAQADEANKQMILASCDDASRCKRILIDDAQNVLGFVMYFKSREPSLESIKRALEQQMGSVPFSDEQIKTMYPFNIKDTDAECAEFILIEGIAVDKNERNKGYGKMLIRHALEDMQKRYPGLIIKLNTEKDNTVACKLYESAGFVVSEMQPLAFMNVVQLEKQLK